MKRITIFIISLVFIAATVMVSIFACSSRSCTLSCSCVPFNGGSVSPAYGTYDKDAEIDIQAIPATDYIFDHWEGSASGTSPNIHLVMDSNKDVIAYFKAATTKSMSLVSGTINIAPGHYYEIPFTIDLETMKDVRVEGMFQASGGSGNDIKAYIFGHAAFLDWFIGYSSTPLYYSGQITNADINVNISNSGAYHLVFENKFSTISSKSVFAQVTLHWSE